MKKNTTQQIMLVVDYWQAKGDDWADIAVHALSTIAGHAADLPLIDILPVTEFIASHSQAAYDRLNPESVDIPYMQQQIKLIRYMDAAMQRSCDDVTDKLAAGDATVRDICWLINRAWHTCDQHDAYNYKPVYSLCMALIRTAKCWPPRESEKAEIAEILRTAITDAENQVSQISRRYADDIVF